MVIPRSLIEEMVDHAQRGKPNEVCGLVAAHNGRATRVYRIDSSDPSPVTYRMEPMQQLRAMTEIEDLGWEVGAIYHSHTHTRAYPSATDIKLAFYPGALYVIVSLAHPEAPDVRAFRIEDSNVAEVGLEVI